MEDRPDVGRQPDPDMPLDLIEQELWASGAPWVLYEQEAELVDDEPEPFFMEQPEQREPTWEDVEEAQSLRWLDRMRGK